VNPREVRVTPIQSLLTERTQDFLRATIAKVSRAKVLRTEGIVQLIVFLAAIREILRREIYESNK